jgi:hypothetical protein
MKIIFLIERDFTSTDCLRYGFDELLSLSVDIQIWDLSMLNNVNPAVVPESYMPFVKEIQTVESIQIFNACNVYFVDALSSSKHYKLLEIISNNGGSIIRLQYSFHLDAWTPSLIEALRSKWVNFLNSSNKSIFLLNYFKRLIFKLDDEYSYSDGDVCVYTDSYSRKIAPSNEGVKIVLSHNPQYDEFLLLGKEAIDKGYILYLDNADYYHPDYEELNLHANMSFEEFSESIAKFFNFAKHNMHCDIIVAGHPRVEKKLIEKTYKDATVIQGNTAELVKGAKMVIAMDSTAINYAVLWNKPLIFITTKEIQKNCFYTMLGIESFFKIKPINIDDDFSKIDLISHAELPKKSYFDYINSFIKTQESADKNSWNILVDELRLK